MTFKPGQSGNPKGRQPRSPTPANSTDSRLASTRNDGSNYAALGRRETFDGWANIATAMGTSRDKRMSSFFMPDIVTDIEALNLWRSEDMCRTIIEELPNEAFRRNFTLKVDDKELAEQIQSELEDLNVTESFVKAAQFENAFGGAALYMVTNDAQETVEPLKEEQVTNLSALHLFEPRELWPSSWYTDITSPKFGTPETYRLRPLGAQSAFLSLNVEIHESRMIIFPGKKISRQIQPGQRYGWGDSALSSVYNVIRDYGGAWGSAAAILQDFAQGVYSLEGYAELMKDKEGQQLIKDRMSLFDLFRSTMRMAVIGSGDKFERQTTPIGGMSDLLHDFALRISAAARMPVTVLMGMAPAGLNATGDNDIRGWYDTISARREYHYKPRLERIIKIRMLSKDSATGGVEPKMWSTEFPPLWEPNESERATTRLAIAQTDQIYYNIQSASSDDIAESRWKGDTFSAEMVIDWAKRKAQQALDAKNEAAQQKLALAAAKQPLQLGPGQQPVDHAQPAGGKPAIPAPSTQQRNDSRFPRNIMTTDNNRVVRTDSIDAGRIARRISDAADRDVDEVRAMVNSLTGDQIVALARAVPREDSFNPDQPREPDGKFGEGSSGGQKAAADKLSGGANARSETAYAPVARGKSPAERAHLHEVAGTAHSGAAGAHAAIGDVAQSNAHIVEAKLHYGMAQTLRGAASKDLGAAGSKTEANRRSEAANAKSASASSPTDHMTASAMHQAAASAHAAAGDHDAAEAHNAKAREHAAAMNAPAKVDRHVIIEKKGSQYEAHAVGFSKHTPASYKSFVAREPTAEKAIATVHANYPAHSNNVTIEHTTHSAWLKGAKAAKKAAGG